MSEKKSAEIADTLGLMVDQQIGELVASGSATESPMADTSAHGGNLTQLEAAMLAMDQDIVNGLRLLAECKHKIDNFETFMRALSLDIKDIKQELAHADRTKKY
jgi:hypothetical protein